MEWIRRIKFDEKLKLFSQNSKGSEAENLNHKWKEKQPQLKKQNSYIKTNKYAIRFQFQILSRNILPINSIE